MIIRLQKHENRWNILKTSVMLSCIFAKDSYLKTGPPDKKVMFMFLKRSQKSSSKILRLVWIVLLFCFFICGCTKVAYAPLKIAGYPKPYKVMGKWYQPIPDAQGFEETGIASWYGKPFHGRKTANGEIFNMYKDSAAHKTLPLDTWVRVLNLENKKSFNVRINDRGPFVADRIIDLSYSAAKKLGIAVSGTARVKITVLGARVQTPDKSEHARVQTVINENYYNQTYSIQVGAFTGKENAEKLRRELAKTYENAHIVSFYYGNQTWHRVRVCKSSTLEQAAKDKERMIRAGFKSALVIAE